MYWQLKAPPEIGANYTFEDLLNKYSNIDSEVVTGIFNQCQKDASKADFLLKELDYDETSKKRETELKTELLKSETDSSKVASTTKSSKDERESPSPPLLTPNKSAEPPALDLAKQMSSQSNEVMPDRANEKEMISNFERDHKERNIPRADLDSIIEIIREGQKGINYNEEVFLKAQLTNDYLLLQTFIEKKYEDQKQYDNVNGVNIHSKNDFPSLVRRRCERRVDLKTKRRALAKAARHRRTRRT